MATIQLPSVIRARSSKPCGLLPANSRQKAVGPRSAHGRHSMKSRNLSKPDVRLKDADCRLGRKAATRPSGQLFPELHSGRCSQATRRAMSRRLHWEAEPAATVQRHAEQLARKPKFFEHARAKGRLEFEAATNCRASCVRPSPKRQCNGVQEIAGAEARLDLNRTRGADRRVVPKRACTPSSMERPRTPNSKSLWRAIFQARTWTS